MKLIYVLLTILVAQCVSALKPYILDEADDFDLNYVAKKVCWSWSGSRNQISKFSTLDKLINYFNSLPVEHEFSSCAKKHIKPLTALFELTSKGNEDVCGQEKLTLLEKFHYQYFDDTYRTHLTDISKVLRAFYYQYASYISTLCANRSYIFFEFKLDESHNTNGKEIDHLLSDHVKNIGMKQNFTSYEDLYLVWGLFKRMPTNIHTQISDYLAERSKKLVVKIDKPENVREIQDVCSKSIEPLYSQTLLPTLRLIDLGYYPFTLEFLYQIQNNSFVNRLCKLTLLCETILPISVLENDLHDQQNYLIKPAEVEESQSETEDIRALYSLDPVPLADLEKLPLGSAEEALKQSRHINTNVKSRRRAMNDMVKFMARNMDESHTNVKLWGSNETIDDVAKTVAKRLQPETALSRRKRSAGAFFRNTYLVIRNLFLLVLLGIFFLINLALGLVVLISGLVVGAIELLRKGFESLQVGIAKLITREP